MIRQTRVCVRINVCRRCVPPSLVSFSCLFPSMSDKQQQQQQKTKSTLDIRFLQVMTTDWISLAIEICFLWHNTGPLKCWSQWFDIYRSFLIHTFVDSSHVCLVDHSRCQSTSACARKDLKINRFRFSFHAEPCTLLSLWWRRKSLSVAGGATFNGNRHTNIDWQFEVHSHGRRLSYVSPWKAYCHSRLNFSFSHSRHNIFSNDAQGISKVISITCCFRFLPERKGLVTKKKVLSSCSSSSLYLQADLTSENLRFSLCVECARSRVKKEKKRLYNYLSWSFFSSAAAF